MKGRIIKVENSKFYLITENGEFMSADAVKGFECGDEVEVKKEMPAYIKPLASIAAAVFIVIGGVYGYHIPVRYVDVCINPEIQLSLNVLDRVIAVEGKNTDGEKIISSNKLSNGLKNESIDSAIDDIVDTARSFGYMKNDDNSERDVIVSVYGNNAEKLSKKIPLDNVRVVNETDCEMAEKANISVGRYVLIKELEKVDTEEKTNTANMSVKQIIDKIDEIKSRPKATSSPAVAPSVTILPTVAPELSPQPKPTSTVTAQPTKTPTVSKVSKSNEKKSSVTNSVAAVKKTTQSSKKTSIFTSNKSTVNVSDKFTLTTPSPTVKPSIVQTSATSSPTKAPKITPTVKPQTNEIKRPLPNKNDGGGGANSALKGDIKPSKDDKKDTATQPLQTEKKNDVPDRELPNKYASDGKSDISNDKPSEPMPDKVQPKAESKVSAEQIDNNRENVKNNSENISRTETYSVPMPKEMPSNGNRQPSEPVLNTESGNKQPTQQNPNKQQSGEKMPNRQGGGEMPSAPHGDMPNGGKDWR